MKYRVLFLMVLLSYNFSIAQISLSDSINLCNLIDDTSELYDSIKLNYTWYTYPAINVHSSMQTNFKFTYGMSYKFKLMNEIDSYINADTSIRHKKKLFILEEKIPFFDIVLVNNLDSVELNGEKKPVTKNLINNDSGIKIKNKYAVLIEKYFKYWYELVSVKGVEYCISNKITCTPSFCKWRD